MKIRPVTAGLFYAGGQEDKMTKLLVAFRNFSKAPKNVQIGKPLRIPSKLSFIKTQTYNGAGQHQKAYVFVKALVK
jgi:hypothetical protein